MFTKQHYEAIADILKPYASKGMGTQAQTTSRSIALDLMDFFQKDNPNFNRKLFAARVLGNIQDNPDPKIVAYIGGKR